MSEEQLPALPEELLPHPASTYDPEVVRAVCEDVADGKTMTESCEKRKVNRCTLHSWLQRVPGARQMYQEARTQAAHGLFDEIVTLAREAHDAAKDEVRGIEVSMRGLQWAAGRLLPYVYGDRPPASQAIAVHITTSLSLDKPSAESEDDRLYKLSAKPIIDAEVDVVEAEVKSAEQRIEGAVKRAGKRRGRRRRKK